MGSASPERSRSCEALAHFPQESSRGRCRDGLLYRLNTHVWCSVLLFRHRPRPAQDPALQCDAKSQCSLGRAAIARSVGLQTAAPILAIRPRLKVWSRCGSGCEGHRKPAHSHCLAQSVAEGLRFTLHLFCHLRAKFVLLQIRLLVSTLSGKICRGRFEQAFSFVVIAAAQILHDEFAFGC